MNAALLEIEHKHFRHERVDVIPRDDVTVIDGARKCVIDVDVCVQSTTKHGTEHEVSSVDHATNRQLRRTGAKHVTHFVRYGYF